MKRNLLAALAGLVLAFSSGSTASAKSILGSVAVGAQSPSLINSGDTATCVVTVFRTGAGRLNVDLSCSGLPTGATASFSKNPLVFTANSPATETATLTISTTASTPEGTYTFRVTAHDTRNNTTLTNTGTLTVGSDGRTSLTAQFITSINVQPDGSAAISLRAAANKPYVIQATSALNPTSWTSIATNTTDATGICVFMDLDAANYSARFYRTAVSN